MLEEDRKNLKILAEEVPKLSKLIEELIETIDIMGNEEEVKAIRESLEQVKKGELKDWDNYINELRKKGKIQSKVYSKI